MPSCELFPLVAKPGFLRVWQVNYCQGDYSRCARFERVLAGRRVPKTLLPNGEELTALASKE